MKEAIWTKINSTQGTSFTRQAFDSKNKNIPLSTFIKLHSEILKLANNIFKNPENDKILLGVGR